jgi:signal transduction histidine kinase
MAPSSPFSRRSGLEIGWNARSWLFAAAVWTLPGLLDAAGFYVSYLERGEPITLLTALARALPKWYVWAALTPLIWGLARRVPLDGKPRVRAIGIHAAAAVAATTIHLSLAGLYYYLAWGGPEETLAAVLRWYLVTVFPVDYLAYWAIVGIFFILSYRRMYRDRELAASRLAASLAEARLQALQMQLQPHFLFNTLNTLAGLARDGRQAEVVALIAELGDLLRYSLANNDRQEVSLEEELEFVERYLAIEGVRFGDRLTVAFEIEPEALGAAVPTLLLQPIVENAIRHGIAASPLPGRIDIRAHAADGRLRIEVRDNGIGLDLNGSAPRQGIGLENTRARLFQLHGNRSALRMQAAEGGGMRLVLELPLRPVSSAPAPLGPASHPLVGDV